MDRLRVSYNLATNIGRYPHPTAGGCCVQFLGLDNVVTPDGQIHWKHANTPGQSGVEDNIGFYVSGGTDSAHRIDVGYNLIDGAYPLRMIPISPVAASIWAMVAGAAGSAVAATTSPTTTPWSPRPTTGSR